ncbi:MAG: COP23 domain-containing protein, partial [Xenococcus sp. (in: cyanobacteria)]
SELSNAQVDNYPTDRVSFYCGETLDQASGQKIPTTLAWVPQREANIPIIGWKNEYFGAWNSQKRCEAVSPKFQTFYEDGRLNYLTNGESAGYPIICAVLDKEEQCSGENQLFQVRPGTNPEEVITGLNGILGGKTSDSEPIYQSSGNRVYISVSGFLENAPAVEDDN